jgi:hypothetical protein
MLEKKISQDKIEIVGEFKAVQVRKKTAIMEDGIELSASYHRHVIMPTDDVAGESPEIQALCAVVHTDAIKDAYMASFGVDTLPEEGIGSADTLPEDDISSVDTLPDDEPVEEIVEETEEPE